MRIAAARRLMVLPWALCALCVAGCGALHRPEAHTDADEEAEVAFLIRRNTAEGFATASLLAHLTRQDDGAAAAADDPQILIDKAVALSPGRPELVWLELRDCQQRRCPDETTIASRLRALDPDNGLAWLAELNASLRGPPEVATKVLAAMAAASRPQVYWNQLTVMMYDALTHPPHSPAASAIARAPNDRLAHVTGVLAAVDSPAFQTLIYACRLDHLDLPGRRAACEGIMQRLEDSDAALVQNLSMNLEETWWREGSPEYAALERRRRQLAYLVAAPALRAQADPDGDARLRIDLMRRLPREEDVERAVLATYRLPPERPADWHPPGDGG